MRIGVDIQTLCRPVTGIERYAGQMLRELFKQSIEDQFFLYAPKPILHDFDEIENITLRHSNMNFRGDGILCSQICMPSWSKKDNIDVFWGPSHRIPRFLSNKIAKVVTIHDLVWRRAGETMRPLSRLAEGVFTKSAINLADMIVADSYSTADDIIMEFPHTVDHVKVVHLGASSLPQSGDIKELNSLGVDRPYFLFVGTLEPRKNLRQLLKAFAAIDASIRKRFHLVIAGGMGWGRENLVSLIGSLGLTDEVRLTGYVSEQTLATLYSHALFLAMPSLYEGFGLPLVEAMSLGTPALTSSVSSLPEVAGDAAVFVDPSNTASITEGIMKMLTDDKYRLSLAAHSVANAKRFSWEKAAHNMMNIFNEALSIKRK